MKMPLMKILESSHCPSKNSFSFSIALLNSKFGKAVVDAVDAMDQLNVIFVGYQSPVVI